MNPRATSAKAKRVTTKIPAVLLAGGLARRMGGGDKPMRRIGGLTILERVIARQERTIRRDAQYERNLGPVRRGPVEGCEYPGKRSGKIGDAIGDDRQAERREAGGIAVGIEDQPVALRL